MASRAAVDEWMRDFGINLTDPSELTGKAVDDLERWLERNYSRDEDDLRCLGKTLYGLDHSANEFATWRAEVFKRAKDIVALPHVNEAIFKTHEKLLTQWSLAFQEVVQILLEA
jgi:hypothetical protein